MGRPLPATFYRHDAVTVAKALLGKTLLGDVDGVRRRARITETEAYVGEHDRASHARFGRTERNRAMYGPAGRAYVYLVYGVHHCLNVVCSEDGDPQAVLVRSAEPLDGWDARLTGPGLLARGFGVTRSLDGHDLRTPPLWIETGPAPQRIRASPRVGVAYAGPWARRRLRFETAEEGPVAGRRTFKRKHASGPRHG